MHMLYVAMDETDYSRRALILGRNLAVQIGVSLSITSVVSDSSEVECRQEILAARLDDKQDPSLKDLPVKVLVHDNVETQLAKLVEEEGAWLCMSAHGHRPVPEMIIGSVTAGVVRRASLPVVLCGPQYAPERHVRAEVVMVCVDGSSLSESILPHVISLVQALGARLQLLHVIDASAPAALMKEGGHGDVIESGFIHSLANRLQKKYVMQVDWEVLHGKPAEAIVSYLAQSRDVILAMTTHGRSGLSQVVAGSVSHEVIHDVCCPVALFHPRL